MATNNIAYIVVEAADKDSTKSNATLTGLFLGIKTIIKTLKTEKIKDDTKYIWLTSDDELYILHPDYYDVTKIKIGRFEDNTKTKINTHTLSPATIHPVIALERLYCEFGDEHRLNDDGLIDLSTYKDIPKDLLISLPTNTNAKSNLIKSTGRDTKQAKQGTIKLVASVIKRTGDYNAKRAINDMAKKIEKLRDGTYDDHFLKKVLKQLDESLASTTQTDAKTCNADDDDDEDTLYGHPYGFVM